jgi:XapX domain-containing protein
LKLEDFLALGVGLALGGLFALLKLPIPAPMTIGGILGIIGIAVGATVVSSLLAG